MGKWDEGVNVSVCVSRVFGAGAMIDVYLVNPKRLFKLWSRVCGRHLKELCCLSSKPLTWPLMLPPPDSHGSEKDFSAENVVRIP